MAAHPTQRVEVRCAGDAPVLQIMRASGVSEVQVHGHVVHCLVAGSFQPFLEALSGHEVTYLQSTPATDPASPAHHQGTHR